MLRLLGILLVLGWCSPALAADQIPITIEQPIPGAPMTFGIPFPQGVLASPDHVRVLDASGAEIPSQITEVSTWEPADPSLKWIWVFFFAGEGADYTVEYGADVVRASYDGPRITFINNQRSRGYADVDTGPLAFRVPLGGPGFLDDVSLDLAGDGHDPSDVIATGPEGRGSFLDLLDAAGIDSSRAVVHHTFKEKGTGPLHAIVRVEGTYRYGREDNAASPFTLRIHAYAGKPFVRVLHTITYTGDPDLFEETAGQHAQIATSDTLLYDEEARIGADGWTEPNDQIAAAGLALRYRLDGGLGYATRVQEGPWWEQAGSRPATGTVGAEPVAVVQDGPPVYGVPTGEEQEAPAPSWPPRMPATAEMNSSSTERIEAFTASVTEGDRSVATVQRADGWMRLTGRERGVAVGLRYFFEEYPKELSIEPTDSLLHAYSWSPSADPMAFARWSADRDDGDMMGNFSTGLTKTTEAVFHFFSADEDVAETEQVMNYVLDPPVAHAPPSWYADSGVFGRMAPASSRFPEFERGLQYKFDWWRFNQAWEPWYGMFHYGDGKAYYFADDWMIWLNNEPASDYMWWMQFMRTGDRDAYLMASATSGHTMDVDNVHWPADPVYYGDTNPAIDYWEHTNQPEGSPYLGIGRRHGWQQWTALLSAHVWVQGWLTSYYLAANHRGLDIARLTADTYLDRIWGEHDLRGRRLYLSVWNLAEVWDATKDPRYAEEVADRVGIMLEQQREQGGNLVIDRYGYTNVYASHGLSKVLQMTGDPDIERALVRHARYVRDNPPLNHGMESFLSSIHSLLVGYELTGDASFYREALQRAEVLKTEPLPEDAFDTMTQQDLQAAMESVSNLPGGDGGGRSWNPIWRISNGLRIFGWTHAYNVPYLLYWLERDGEPVSTD